jgi:hypothetical protein
MYTCLGDDDLDFKTGGGLWFLFKKIVKKNFEQITWTLTWIHEYCTTYWTVQSQFYNLKIRAGILNKMDKLLEVINFVTSKAKLQIRTLNSNQIIPISSWSGGSIRELLLHHLAISLKVLLKMKFQSKRSRIWYWRVILISWWWWSRLVHVQAS